MRVTRIFFSTILVVALSGTWSKAQEKGARADILEIPMAPPGAGARSGFLGVSAEELTAAEMEKLGIAGGLRLTEVENDSPANKAGVAIGDIVLRVEGEEIGGVLQFRNMITGYREGEVVRLRLIQRGEQVEKRVTLGKRPPLPMVVIPPEALEQRGPKAFPNARIADPRFQRFGLGEDGQRFKMRDNDGTVEVVGAPEAREATVWDMSNKVAFEGPWVTPQDKAVPSAKTRQRIERVEKTFALRLRGPKAFLPQLRPDPAPRVPAIPPKLKNAPKSELPEPERGK